MRNGGGKGKYVRIHRLVCAAFLGKCPEGREVNHKNGVKSDNRIENLEYVTPKENIQHAREVLGIISAAKLTEDDVKAIRKRRRSGELLASIARDFDVGRASVGNVVRRRTWKHVG